MTTVWLFLIPDVTFAELCNMKYVFFCVRWFCYASFTWCLWQNWCWHCYKQSANWFVCFLSTPLQPTSLLRTVYRASFSYVSWELEYFTVPAVNYL